MPATVLSSCSAVGFLNAVERPAQHGNVGLVIRKEQIVQPRHLGLGLADPVQAQALHDHGARAAADERVQSLRRNRRQSDLLKHVIGGRRQIRGRVDDRAVEIEDDGAVVEIGVHWVRLGLQGAGASYCGFGVLSPPVSRWPVFRNPSRARHPWPSYRLGLPQTWAAAPEFCSGRCDRATVRD